MLRSDRELGFFSGVGAALFFFWFEAVGADAAADFGVALLLVVAVAAAVGGCWVVSVCFSSWTFRDGGRSEAGGTVAGAGTGVFPGDVGMNPGCMFSLPAAAEPALPPLCLVVLVVLSASGGTAAAVAVAAAAAAAERCIARSDRWLGREPPFTTRSAPLSWPSLVLFFATWSTRAGRPRRGWDFGSTASGAAVAGV